jgi:hypothetical protein
MSGKEGMEIEVKLEQNEEEEKGIKEEKRNNIDKRIGRIKERKRGIKQESEGR